MFNSDRTTNWADPLITDCPSSNPTSQDLQSLAEANVNNGDVSVLTLLV